MKILYFCACLGLTLLLQPGFKLRAKVDMWQVPSKGSPPAIVDLISGAPC